ncbi:fructosamine kinase family protein [Thermocoleostomius sinensis]|jgi:fructosamine-3-kinase|uniref:Fructosamine kinase family protein n=1 Tax=Thermocoleostomius sinensis A174 TaxID=2016057 RepID=A0A9E8ZBD8_9CYAN|nr:fructosamine kinase family protein [Thermocoleostomius sinensis]WAL60130.1 fructosamine kinase family protein [Thermocoleostomius sinensis A174]
MWNQIADQISRATGKAFQVEQHRSVSGGSVNQAYALVGGAQSYFVKLNQASRVDMFAAEALGLQQIFSSHTIRVPQPICWGIAGNSAYLVLEWLELGRGDSQAWAAMGRQLAAMHQVTSSQGFGWERNNTIGFIPQVNHWSTDWVDFFTTHRLGYQFRLAKRRGGHFPLQERLLAAVPDILAGYNPQPSLVHGDLWTGNAAVTVQGDPVILDPATYFGDREVDLAMSQLFGSFPSNFYSAYDEVWPLEPGYQQRKILYNLYHILNHFNQFGGSYEHQANQMIASLL